MITLSIDKGDLKTFIQANTELLPPPLVPEIRLYLASEVFPLWHASEKELAECDLPPPYWAFAWAGGQGLARYILDHPEVVAGKRVLDFACGGGIQGIAAARAGAAVVEVSDIDPFALAAVSLNAVANEVHLDMLNGNLLEQEGGKWDVILAGDVCYEGPMAAKVECWLRHHVDAGAEVLLGDPGRTYLPRTGLERIIAYAVKTTRELEDTDVRNAVVWRVESTKFVI